MPTPDSRFRHERRLSEMWQEAAYAQAGLSEHAFDARWGRTAIAHIERTLARERITPERLCQGGTQALVLAGRHRRWGAVVVKCHCSPADALAEVRALRHWVGCPVPRVHRSQGPVIVAERIRGTHPTHDPAADQSLGALVQVLAGPAPTWAPLLARRLERSIVWAQPYLAALTAAERTWAHAAISRAYHQARTAPATHLLHGDLLPKNIIRTHAEWCAIDPLPCAGPLGYDCATWALGDHDPLAAGDRLAAASGTALDEVRAWTRHLAIFSWLRATPARRARLARLIAP